MTPRAWYHVDMTATDPAVAEIYIIDFIGDWIDDFFGFGVTAKAFVEHLSKLPDAVTTIRVHVNSPGGDVFAALNIANALRDQRASKGRRIEMIVDGLAASSASVVLMAGETIQIADNALVMIHNPWTVAVGAAADLRKVADEMEKIRATIITTYGWHSTLSADELGALMDAETWFDADEAVAAGFATEKVEGLKAAASLDPKMLGKLTVPEKYRARVDALVTRPAPAPPAPVVASAGDVLAAVDAAGFGAAFAKELLDAALPMLEVQARIDAAAAERTRETARAKEISALCATAKLSDLAAGYLAGSMRAADVRAHLTTITARLDRVEINGGLDPDQGVRPKPVINVAAIYAARNRVQ